MPLERYRQKRDFQRTPEPAGRPLAAKSRYVLHKHRARNLHYDLRLELDGVLKSWAIPKGPSLDPTVKRLAVHVEDHPLDYVNFEGVIPQGQYGAGPMIIWDHGQWQPLEGGADGYRTGKLKFRLFGIKLHGDWMLVRIKSYEQTNNWLLIKERDDEALPEEEYDLLAARPESSLSGRTIEELAQPKKKLSGVSTDQLTKRCGELAGAKQARQPRHVEPQLAKPTASVPQDARWLHETKLDGYRLIAHRSADHMRLLTRRGHDWTERFPPIAQAIQSLQVDHLILDGELVVQLPDGASSFQELQRALREERLGQLVYFAFDLLYLGGYDLRPASLVERKALLKDLLAGAPSRLQFCDHLTENGQEFLRQCCERGLEGIVSKRSDRPYRSGRGDDWLKAKCVLRDEFVVGGFTDPDGKGFRALLVGNFADRKLHYVGKVGTGFGEVSQRELREKLRSVEQPECPFATVPPGVDKNVHWVAPRLVVQIEYTNLTEAGHLRHPSFQGVRDDVEAVDVVRDNVSSPAVSKRDIAAHGSARHKASPPQLDELADVKMTHPTRVLYPDEQLTKLDLAAYYVSIADWILPHVVERPLSLVRCPRGLDGESFFQKHPFRGMPEEIKHAPIAKEDHDAKEQLYIRDLRGLVSLVQISALEIHPWGARIDRPDRPDRMVFDLDPDEMLPWPNVVAAAHRLHDVLTELSLTSFVKTSGGKGLHVVVPLARRNTWQQVKEFSLSVASQFAKMEPQRYTTSVAKAARPGKILIDVNRNHQGATSVAPYSTRAREGAFVSVPLAWEELTPRIRNARFHVGNVADRLAKLASDPWEKLAHVRQSITKAMLTRAGK